MKKIVMVILSVSFALCVLGVLQCLVTPKYMDDVIEGAFTAEYYEEETKHDVIMIGDCEVYETFNPIELWQDYGITSYIRGSAQQLIWQSYYLLEDALQYETPKVVIYNVQSMMHDTPQKEEYNRMTIDGMRWSKYKWQCIQASMLPGESAVDYVFPILRYHGRILDLEKSDYKYIWDKKKVSHNGYYMRVDVLPYTEENALEETKPQDTDFGENAWDYLNRICDLCEKNDIQLLLVKAPSLFPIWFDEYESQIEQFAQERQLPYLNYLELVDEVKLDYTTDTYDAGLHMNLSGATKLSVHLGQYLKEHYALKDWRTDEEYTRVWKEKVGFYQQMKQEQEKEMRESGKLESFGGEKEAPPDSVEDEEYDTLDNDIFGGFE